MSTWLLCFVLVRSDPQTPPVCVQFSSQQQCVAALREWLQRAWAWEDRSRLHGQAIATCGPDR
jgi:hypothetical protein